MRINIIQSVLKANDAVASSNRKLLDEKGIVALNLMSAPGSGKTQLLEKTISALARDHACGVLVGDLQTTRDAERLEPLAIQTVQINTGTGCHLSAAQVHEGLSVMDLDRLQLLFIENVGNMVCPAAFDLGEHKKVVLLSVVEGDDKVAKYPTLFQQADIILITKTDLLSVVEFDRRRVDGDLSRINTHAAVLELSARTGQGMQTWLDWLESTIPVQGASADPVELLVHAHAPAEAFFG